MTVIENNEIIRIYGTEFKENTKKLLVEADLADMIPSKKCRIAIKPNLVSASEASWGATTHTEILAGIIEYLQERGYNNLVIAVSCSTFLMFFNGFGNLYKSNMAKFKKNQLAKKLTLDKIAVDHFVHIVYNNVYNIMVFTKEV